MRRSKFRRPCKVLIFNGARVLVAIVRSLHCAAEGFGEFVHLAADGLVNDAGVYLRRGELRVAQHFANRLD